MSRGKYERLGKEYPMGNTPALHADQLTGLRDLLMSYGLTVKMGG